MGFTVAFSYLCVHYLHSVHPPNRSPFFSPLSPLPPGLFPSLVVLRLLSAHLFPSNFHICDTYLLVMALL